MTGLFLTSETVQRCVSEDRETDRRWRPCKTGTFVAVEVTVLEGAPA